MAALIWRSICVETLLYRSLEIRLAYGSSCFVGTKLI